MDSGNADDCPAATRASPAPADMLNNCRLRIRIVSLREPRASIQSQSCVTHTLLLVESPTIVNMPTRRILAVIALFVLAAQAAEKRLIKADDIYLFHWVADPQISPDGSQVAYTYVSVNAKHDGYDTSLWLVPAAGGAPRQIT